MGSSISVTEEVKRPGSVVADWNDSSHTEASLEPGPSDVVLKPVISSRSLRSATAPSSFARRLSRASSIVSTGTGLTIGTLQEETKSLRSVDVVIGVKLFHINRDASKISTLGQNDLPPYSPPHQTAGTASRSHEIQLSASDLPVPSPGPSDQSGRILPGNQDQFIERSLSFNPGPDQISVEPNRRSASQGHIPQNAYHSSGQSVSLAELRRRNGVRVPKILTAIPPTDETDLADLTPTNNEATNVRFTRSAGPSIGDDAGYPRSPSDTGPNATGEFPAHLEPSSSTSPLSDQGPFSDGSGPQILIPQSPAQFEEKHADGSTPPPMESENDIRIHFSRLIRSLDRDHRKALHARDKELAVMRERLNELDQVYRKELKSRDFAIDDLRKSLQHLNEQMQAKIEKTKNDIEEQWENRWKVRDQHYMERMRRMEMNFQKQLEQADRDVEWAAEFKRMKQLLQSLRLGDESNLN
ncbi:hypothetical protein PRK78_006249 [Emydomyces testavorans]|uniref:Uncharacterized protein n=1 Tax=Emydomyces testavorans TaxID=2070801 RepID=A0AAF0ILH3_9EURO|nr:hypothetical protein PRK78_006249 [Emydomyces testavorans]